MSVFRLKNQSIFHIDLMRLKTNNTNIARILSDMVDMGILRKPSFSQTILVSY